MGGMSPTQQEWCKAYAASFHAVKTAARLYSGDYALVLDCGHQVTVSESALRSPFQCLECFRRAGWEVT